MISLKTMIALAQEGGRTGCVGEELAKLDIDYDDFVELVKIYAEVSVNNHPRLPAKEQAAVGFGMGTLFGIKLAQLSTLEEVYEGSDT